MRYTLQRAIYNTWSTEQTHYITKCANSVDHCNDVYAPYLVCWNFSAITVKVVPVTLNLWSCLKLSTRTHKPVNVRALTMLAYLPVCWNWAPRVIIVRRWTKLSSHGVMPAATGMLCFEQQVWLELWFHLWEDVRRNFAAPTWILTLSLPEPLSGGTATRIVKSSAYRKLLNVCCWSNSMSVMAAFITLHYILLWPPKERPLYFTAVIFLFFFISSA